MDRLLTLGEVAEMLRTPPATLRFWRHETLKKDGTPTGPPSFKIGRRIVYREQDVAEWLDARYAADRTPA